MSLKWGSTGRPMAECPRCGRIHPIRRPADYAQKPQQRFRCKNPDCGTTWKVSDEERQQILAYFADRAGKRSKPSGKTTPPKGAAAGAQAEQQPKQAQKADKPSAAKRKGLLDFLA